MVAGTQIETVLQCCRLICIGSLQCQYVPLSQTSLFLADVLLSVALVWGIHGLGDFQKPALTLPPHVLVRQSRTQTAFRGLE